MLDLLHAAAHVQNNLNNRINKQSRGIMSNKRDQPRQDSIMDMKLLTSVRETRDTKKNQEDEFLRVQIRQCTGSKQTDLRNHMSSFEDGKVVLRLHSLQEDTKNPRTISLVIGAATEEELIEHRNIMEINSWTREKELVDRRIQIMSRSKENAWRFRNEGRDQWRKSHRGVFNSITKGTKKEKNLRDFPEVSLEQEIPSRF